MNNNLRFWHLLALALMPLPLLPMPALSQELTVSVEVPRLQVAEYHNPYIALWLQDEDKQTVINLGVWYDLVLPNAEGEKWLKDMRLWWRRSGRSLDMPVDGITGATRAPGTHSLRFKADDDRLLALAPGQYRLFVEAAREVGGREVVEVPFVWPPHTAHTLEAQGTRELGKVRLKLSAADE